MRWVQIGGRWHGQNPDGSDHWDLCSQRKLQHFQIHGTEFKTKQERGLKNKVLKDKLAALEVSERQTVINRIARPI